MCRAGVLPDYSQYLKCIKCLTTTCKDVVCVTCFIGQSEDDPAVWNAAHVAYGGDAAVVSVVLRPQVLQLQDLSLPLQLRARGREQFANVCSSTLPSKTNHTLQAK